MSKKDLIFKKLMQSKEVAEEFLTEHLPGNVKHLIDISSIKPEKSDFVEDDLRGYYADVLLSCKLKESDEQAFIVLVENQDRNDPLMPLRLIRYTCSVLENYIQAHNLKNKGHQSVIGKLPTIFPVIFYTGTGVMNNDVFKLFNLPDVAKSYTFQPAKVISVSKYTRDQLLKLSPKVLLITELLMFDSKGNNCFWKLISENKDKLLLSHITPALSGNLLEKSVQYIIEVSNLTASEVQKMLSDRLPDQKEKVSVAFKHWYKTEGIYIEKKTKDITLAKAALSVSADFNVSIEAAAKSVNATKEALDIAKQMLKDHH